MDLEAGRYRRVGPSDVNLGFGTYGVVFEAIDTKTNEVVALKKIKLEVEDEGIPSTTLREIATLRLLRHPNIVDLRDVIYGDNKLSLVFEYVTCDLRKFLTKYEGPLPAALVKSFSKQMMEGIEFCHSHGVMHRDLKPQNILISDTETLKICDFGLARAFVPPMRAVTHEVVTLWYRAPEVLLGEKVYSLGVDTWSAGAVIAEMVTKRALLNGDSEIDEIFKIFELFGTPTEETWPGVTSIRDWNAHWPIFSKKSLSRVVLNFCDSGIDLLERLMELDPRNRVSAREALSHPYLSSSSGMILDT